MLDDDLHKSVVTSHIKYNDQLKKSRMSFVD